jgi:hypothetical protein
MPVSSGETTTTLLARGLEDPGDLPAAARHLQRHPIRWQQALRQRLDPLQRARHPARRADIAVLADRDLAEVAVHIQANSHDRPTWPLPPLTSTARVDGAGEPAGQRHRPIRARSSIQASRRGGRTNSPGSKPIDQFTAYPTAICRLELRHVLLEFAFVPDAHARHHGRLVHIKRARALNDPVHHTPPSVRSTMIAARRSSAYTNDAEARAQGNSPGFRPKLPRRTPKRAHWHQESIGVGARHRDRHQPRSRPPHPQRRFHIAAGGEPASTTPKKAPVPDHPNLRPAPDGAFKRQFHASNTGSPFLGQRADTANGCGSSPRASTASVSWAMSPTPRRTAAHDRSPSAEHRVSAPGGPVANRASAVALGRTRWGENGRAACWRSAQGRCRSGCARAPRRGGLRGGRAPRRVASASIRANAPCSSRSCRGDTTTGCQKAAVAADLARGFRHARSDTEAGRRASSRAVIASS